jgi:hypothetical protein
LASTQRFQALAIIEQVLMVRSPGLGAGLEVGVDGLWPAAVASVLSPIFFFFPSVLPPQEKRRNALRYDGACSLFASENFAGPIAGGGASESDRQIRNTRIP